MQDPSMIFSVLILLTCAVNLGCSATVELYSRQNYSGLLKKAILNQVEENKCNQLDQTYEVRSLKTEKCIMVYETEDCNRINGPAEGSKMYSIRVERDTAFFDIDSAYSERKEERGVQSFHLCDIGMGGWFTGDAEVRGRLLNVDIYSSSSYTGDLVASYRGVCKCKNLPSYMSNGLKGTTISIDNNGKNMYFYDKEDCNGQKRFIPAGDSEISRFVLRVDDLRAVVIRSFRLADGLPCPELDALVYKFTFSFKGESTKWITQKKTYTLANREYINVNNSDTAKYTVAKAFTYMNTTRVKAGFLKKSHESITHELGSTLESSLEAHYRYPDKNTPTIVTKSETRMVGTEYSYPCTAYTGYILVDTYQGYPIIYTAEAIITGVAGEDKVSAEQIRHFLPPGMKYVKRNDDYSVVVTVEGEMKGTTVRSYPYMSYATIPDC